jgi:hypothetical protein
MRFTVLKSIWLCALVLISSSASAELQNVTLGGSIEVFGAYYSDIYESNPDLAVRIPDFLMPKRPIGPFGTESWYSADGESNSQSFVEQRTRLHVNADMTDHVRAFIELDDIAVWGEDFRSDYVTGTDLRPNTGDDLEVFQSYIEAQELAGQPLTLRIGRQAMTFGSGWLVGENPASNPFTGLSFDAVRATWNPGKLTLDAWWSKLAESNAAEEDGDVDFCGLYASYAATQDVVFDAYWMFVRDAGAISDTDGAWQSEWVENWLGYDDYDVTNLHTLGLRSAGTVGAVDWEVEGAYQFGNADRVGSLFRSGAYGDDEANWNTWGAHGEVGYTFDCAWKPRVHTGGAYFDGEDNRSLTFAQWLNPFYRPKASVSFNRLFSDYETDGFFDFSSLSNFWEWYAGVSATPVEKVEVRASVLYQAAVDGFDLPRSLHVGKWAIPYAPDYSFLTESGSKDLGWQVSLCACYQYSEDLSFEAGYTHLFAGEGLEDGAFVEQNALLFDGGRGHDDADYIYGYTKLEF